MGRKQNEKVWNQFKAVGKGAECQHCKKNYVFANVNKMQTHLLKCTQCPEEIRRIIEKESTDSELDTSNSSQASSTSAFSTSKSTPKSKTARISSFVDRITVAENVSHSHLFFQHFSYIFLVCCRLIFKSNWRERCMLLVYH